MYFVQSYNSHPRERMSRSKIPQGYLQIFMSEVRWGDRGTNLVRVHFAHFLRRRKPRERIWLEYASMVSKKYPKQYQKNGNTYRKQSQRWQNTYKKKNAPSEHMAFIQRLCNVMRRSPNIACPQIWMHQQNCLKEYIWATPSEKVSSSMCKMHIHPTHAQSLIRAFALQWYI